MKHLNTLLLFILLPVCLLAQQLPDVYEIKIDTGIRVPLGQKRWQILEDPKGSFTIDQISSAPLVNHFHFGNPKAKVESSTRIFWYRYRLKNITSHNVKIALPENCLEAHVYVKDSLSNKWIVQTSGSSVPWSKRDGLKKKPFILQTIKPGQEIFFYEQNRFGNTNAPTNTNFYIAYYDTVVQRYFIDEDNSLNSKHPILMSVLTGILLLAGVINLIFFGIVKERFYLLFGLYALLSAYRYFMRDTDIWFREMPDAADMITTMAVCLATVLNVAFLRIYLNVKSISKKIDRTVVILTVLYLCIGLTGGLLKDKIALTPYSILSFINIAVAWTMSLLASVIIVKIWLRRLPDAYLKAATIGPLHMFPVIILAIMLINLLSIFFNISTSLWGVTEWVIKNNASINMVFSSWLIIGMSVVLFKRFQDLQNKIVYDALALERFEREQETERNQLIAKQNEELEQQVAQRTAELSQSLTNLKSTQTQLIQSEKMASLGELTAGIAHEIQNPLNFVNNFSEVNREMIDELKEELKAGNIDEALHLADDILQNEEKITHHGKRADFIVKGMLQHSRTSTGEKQLTNINVLTDEFLKLSYHGLRAKDKIFNANLVTHFDENLPKVNLAQQDIGRVLLNLFNNAFYAVGEKAKTAGADYKPEVKVTTATENNQVMIRVTDNGIGIPDALKEKIMQPFFTTKPTGQGTGLGLSLSYDIVVKGHGGQLTITSQEGQYTEFMVSIPA